MVHMSIRAKIESLPPQPTAFVGREDEITEAMEMLADSHCRLLTLAGPGGIGKSRLALEIAERSLGYYPDGVYFVDLQPIYTSTAFLQVTADTLHCQLSGQQPAFEQLRDFLRGKDMLLLLDNFEQLLPEGAEGLVSELLNACPELTLLITSREVLNLRQEWVWRVPGLAFPQEQTTKSAETYDAVRLFVERARHVRSDFLIENELPNVLQICQLVEGMPLALELAACWLKVLPCKAIAEEIRRNLDFLNSHQRDLPERHRSIRAVFEQCWRLLSPEEQLAINRLSIFKGGFRREAAEEVAGATLATLLLLSDKSLLRLEPGGRFHMHELVRQYAAEQLGDAEPLLDAHCTHYAEALHRRFDDLCGGRQLEASAEIAEELDNIRAAWEHAVKQGDCQSLFRLTTPYALFCQFRGRYQEAFSAYHGATQRIITLEPTPEADLALGGLFASLGWIYIRLGQMQNAETTFEKADAAFSRLGIAPTVGYASDPSIGRGVIALVRGDYDEAEQQAQQARQTAEKSQSVSNLTVATRTLAEAYLRQGKHDTALHYALQAYQLCEEAGDRWFMAYCLTTLGEISIEMQQYDAAKKHFEYAYALRQEIRDPEGMALVLSYLGDIALQQQLFDEALRYFDESKLLYEYHQVGDPGGLAKALCGLSRAHLFLRNHQAASEHCRKALHIAVTIQYVPVLLQLLTIVGELCYRVQKEHTGLQILALILNHSAANHAARTAVRQFLARNKIGELPSLVTGYDLQNIASLMQVAADTELLLLEIAETKEIHPPARVAPARTENQSLFDPLSQRELEVLSYIAVGLQNREIADRLSVSLNTVKTHINNIYSKLDVTNRVQAVARAHEIELL